MQLVLCVVFLRLGCVLKPVSLFDAAVAFISKSTGYPEWLELVCTRLGLAVSPLGFQHASAALH